MVCRGRVEPISSSFGCVWCFVAAHGDNDDDYEDDDDDDARHLTEELLDEIHGDMDKLKKVRTSPGLD